MIWSARSRVATPTCSLLSTSKASFYNKSSYTELAQVLINCKRRSHPWSTALSIIIYAEKMIIHRRGLVRNLGSKNDGLVKLLRHWGIHRLQKLRQVCCNDQASLTNLLIAWKSAKPVHLRGLAQVVTRGFISNPWPKLCTISTEESLICNWASSLIVTR